MKRLTKDLSLIAIRVMLSAVMIHAGSALGQTGSSQFVQNLPLSFTMTAGGQNPIPQLVTLANTGASYIYVTSATATTTSGGSWLSPQSTCNGSCVTPAAFFAAVNGSGLSAGTYAGQIVFSGSPNVGSGTVTMTVPVTLTVVPPGTPAPGGLTGGLQFVAGNSYIASFQSVQLVNVGSGTLNWTAKTAVTGSTNFLGISSTSGTGPSTVAVSVSTQGLAAGTYAGEVVFQTANGNISVPVSLIVVGPTTSKFPQTSGLNFVMAAGGSNPLPQIVTLENTGASYIYLNTLGSTTGLGVNWLKATSPCNGSCVTPSFLTVSVDGSKLPVGIYTGQVLVVGAPNSGDGSASILVPVTLTVVASGVSALADLPGDLTFVAGNGYKAASQTINIFNRSSGPLAWTASSAIFRTNAAGTANWLSLSATSGTAPSALTVNINPQGLTVGTYLGQVVLQTPSGNVTIPVNLKIVDSGVSAFQELPPLSFSMQAGSSNPLPQTIFLTNTGPSYIYLNAPTIATGTGGTWLSVNSDCAGGCVTPGVYTVSVNGSGLAAGIYTGELLFFGSPNSGTGTASAALPVTLTVSGSGTPSLGGVPGGISFVSGAGNVAVPQTIRLTNTGTGAADWSASVSTVKASSAITTDWLILSATSGTAPSSLTLTVSPQGLTPGVYMAQVSFQSSGGSSSMPVTLTVVDGTNSAFQQAPALNFTVAAGGSPMDQYLDLANTGTSYIRITSVSASTASGGKWLSYFGNACGGACVTPVTYFTHITSDSLAPGTYTGQFTITGVANSGGFVTTVVPVTVTVVAATEPRLEGVAGGLTFISVNGATPSPQDLKLPVAGSGPIAWTAKSGVLRSGATGSANWLSLSSSSGTTPSVLTVSASAQGLAAGAYFGQVLIETASGSITVPVNFVVTDSNSVSTFQQPTALSFSMPVGGALPAPQTVTVSGTKAGLNWDISTYYFQGPAGINWLKISGCGSNCSGPQTYTVSITASTLPAGTYVGQLVCQGSSKLIVPVTLTVGASTAPTITSGGVVPLYSSVNTIQPGEWVSIYGTNLATATATWSGDFPTSLAGTSVTVNGKPAYLWLVSPGQINLQAPDDTATGPVPVVVKTPNGTSTSTVTLGTVAPSFNLLDGKHVTGIILRSNGSGAFGGGSYDIIGPTGTSLGYPTVAAAAGDTISLYGVGFGPTNPAVPAGKPFSGSAPLTSSVTVSIGGVSVPASFAGMWYSGSYQINLTLPAGLGSGDLALQATVGGAKTPAGTVISLK